MRIAVIAQTYRPATNGAAVFAINLAEGLAHRGHAVLVLMPSNRLRTYHENRDGVQVSGIRAVPLAPLFRDIYVSVLPGRRVGQALDQFHPDVVHVHDHYPLSRTGLSAARARRLPVVGTNNFLPENLVPHLPLSSAGRRLVERILWRTVLDVFDRVDVVTAATETSASILRRQGLRRPAMAISCGVDLERFHPDPGVDRAAVRRRIGLDAERTTLIYVGRIDPDKRLDILLQAMQRLPHDDVQLAIVGRGRQMTELADMARRGGLAERVAFTGYVADEELPTLLNSADLFVMPSEAELQCLAALEAMGTARPVLAADARALPELVRNGRNGYLFRAGDAEDAARRLQQFLSERERWPEMGAASLQMAQPHSVANTVRRYEELYQGLSESGTPVRP